MGIVYSMTGFGTGVQEAGRYRFRVEVKSLNSKGMDAQVRLPRGLSDWEMPLRTRLDERLQRGKVSLNVDCEPLSGQSAFAFNEALLMEIYTSLKATADKLGAESDLFRLAFNQPGILETSGREELTGEERAAADKAVDEAIADMMKFRATEGAALVEKLLAYLKVIEDAVPEVEQLEKDRLDSLHTRLKQALTEHVESDKVDQNRFEQELIYYLEKLDVAEEKDRLLTHIAHFRQTLEEGEGCGRKLGFFYD